MGENICKQSKQQGINLQSIQTAHASQYKKSKKISQKMGRRSKQTFLLRRNTDGQKAHEEMLNITNREMQIKTTGEVSPHTAQNGHHQKV